MTQNFDANSTNVTEVRTNEHTNGRTDERKDENYIPVGINAGGIKKLTEDAFESISPEDWASCCRHVQDVEKRFYSTDIAVDDQVDRLVITVTSSDDDTATASDCDVGSSDDERTGPASGGHEAS